MGYFNPQWDTTGNIWSILPGTRTIVGEERIVCSPPGIADSVAVPREFSPYSFDAAILKNRAQALVEHFNNSGYPYASVTMDFKQPHSPDTVTAVLYVTAEKKYLFAPPRLQGTTATRMRLLLRDITIEPDAPFNRRAIERSVDRLNSRSYISTASAGVPFIETGTDSAAIERIAVPFVITDRSGLGLDGAAGLEAGNGGKPFIHGTVRFNFTNIFHTGEEAQLAYTGDRLQQRLDLGYLQPWIFGLPFAADIGGGLEVLSGQYGYAFGRLGLVYEPAPLWHTGITFNAHTVSREDTADAGETGTFTGANLTVGRRAEPFGDGVWSRELTITTGSGFTRKDRTYTRSNIGFSAGVHLPLPHHLALLVRGVTGHLISRENDLVEAELYRTGGGTSVRGYRDNEFAFRTVLYGQSEVLYYFQKRMAAFLFLDGGLGFTRAPGSGSGYIRMLGYGLGVRVPAGPGRLSIQWARSIEDVRSPGRLHVGFSNSFASAEGTAFSATGVE